MFTKNRPSVRSILSRLPAIDRVVAACAAAAAILVFAFIAIADETMEGETMKFDTGVLLSLRDPANHAIPRGPEWLHSTAIDISALGGVTVISLMVAIVAGYLFLQRKIRTLCLLVGCVAASSVTMLLLKDLFARPRPSIVPQLTSVATWSFPSGHSMLSAVVYLTLAAMLAKSTSSRALKLYYIAVAAVVVIAVGLTRIYLGVHYPTDVLAGCALGSACASLSYLLGEWLERKGKIEGESRR